MRQHFSEVPVPPRDLNSGIPAELSDLVVRLLAKDPADRPASAAVVTAELRKIRQRAGAGTGVILPDAILPDAARTQDASSHAPTRTQTGVTPQVAGASREASVIHLAALAMHPNTMISDVAFAPDGRLLAVTLRQAEFRDSRAPAVQLWDTRAHQPLGPPIQVPCDDIDDVGFSPVGRLLVTGRVVAGADHRPASLVDIDITSRQVTALAAADGRGSVWERAIFSPDGHALLTIGHQESWVKGSRCSIALWDTASRRLLGYPFEGKPVENRGLKVFSPDGHLLAANFGRGEQGGVVLSDTRRRPLTSEISGMFRCSTMAFAPDSRTLALAYDGQVQLFDSALGRPVDLAVNSPASYSSKLAFSPDGRILVLAGSRRQEGDAAAPRAYLFDLHSGQPAAQPIGDPGITYPWRLVFSPDGRTLATLTETPGVEDSTTVRLWEIPGGQPISPDLSVPFNTPLAFSPDSRLFMARSRDSAQLIVWHTGTRRPSTQTAYGRADTFASSPDGRMLATVDKQAGTVHLWGL
jgi:WD40 repeat protein